MASSSSAWPYLGIKVEAAAAVPQDIDLPLHLLVLVHGALLLPVIKEEDSKVQVDQRVGSENENEKNKTKPTDWASTGQQEAGGTHSSSDTACSYALVAFSTSSRLVRATVGNWSQPFHS